MPRYVRDPRRPLALEDVERLLSYDPLSGLFTWKVKRGSRAAGQRAGRLIDTGYIVVHINDRAWRAHSLAWFMSYGEWPSEIDHINRNRSDNRLANLRLSDRTHNNCNKPPSGRKMYSQRKGVSFDKKRGKWVAQIRFGKDIYNLGRFQTEDAAACAYTKKAEELFGEFAFKG